jgi:hypothetical protein
MIFSKSAKVVLSTSSPTGLHASTSAIFFFSTFMATASEVEPLDMRTLLPRTLSEIHQVGESRFSLVLRSI